MFIDHHTSQAIYYHTCYLHTCMLSYLTRYLTSSAPQSQRDSWDTGVEPEPRVVQDPTGSPARPTGLAQAQVLAPSHRCVPAHSSNQRTISWPY